jgi:hypothetical protein
VRWDTWATLDNRWAIFEAVRVAPHNRGHVDSTQSLAPPALAGLTIGRKRHWLNLLLRPKGGEFHSRLIGNRDCNLCPMREFVQWDVMTGDLPHDHG